jgi:hypothetical protein
VLINGERHLALTVCLRLGSLDQPDGGVKKFERLLAAGVAGYLDRKYRVAWLRCDLCLKTFRPCEQGVPLHPLQPIAWFGQRNPDARTVLVGVHLQVTLYVDRIHPASMAPSQGAGRSAGPVFRNDP